MLLYNIMENLSREVTDFGKWLTGERKSRHTVREYTFLVSKFLEHCGKTATEVTAREIEEYKHYMASVKRYAKSTQYLALKAIKLYLKFRNAELPGNLNPPTRSRKLPNYLNEKETSALISKASGNLRNFSIILVLAYTGIRVSELCGLDINDLDLGEKMIRVRSGKGDKDRIVILSDVCASSVERYLEQRYSVKANTGALFLSNKKGRMDTSTVERMVRKLASDAGISRRVTPHVLRHTFATAVLRNGGDIRFIQQILGHASVATTQIYTHIDDRLLRKMYEDHGPQY